MGTGEKERMLFDLKHDNEVLLAVLARRTDLSFNLTDDVYSPAEIWEKN
jgi:hypothetical protein